MSSDSTRESNSTVATGSTATVAAMDTLVRPFKQVRFAKKVDVAEPMAGRENDVSQDRKYVVGLKPAGASSQGGGGSNQ